MIYERQDVINLSFPGYFIYLIFGREVCFEHEFRSRDNREVGMGEICFPDIRVVKSVGLCIRRVLRNAIPGG